MNSNTAFTAIRKNIPPQSEHQIMSAIEDLLRYDGWFVERNNVGAMQMPQKNGRTRFVRFNMIGKSDLTALKNGQYVAIEVKTPKTRNNATHWQLEYLENVNRHGGLGFVAWSLEQVAEKLGIKLLF